MIYLRNATRKYRIDERRIRKTAQALLDALGEGGSSMSISLVGDRAIRTLNALHRGKDCATDVLSFSLVEAIGPGEAMTMRTPPGTERQLGDIVISLDTAQRQASEYGAPLVREVERLMIHGVLHLLGHDHGEPKERARMVRAERRLAGAIGMPWPHGYESGR